MGKLEHKDEKLYSFCTGRQREVLEAYYKNGFNYTKTAKELGVKRQTIQSIVKSIIKKATIRGYNIDFNMKYPVPEEYIVKGVSTLYDADGNVKAQWVKSKLDGDDFIEKLKLVVETLSEEIRGASVDIENDISVFENNLCVYPIADLHIGMFAWAKETGEDYDCKIAETMILSAMKRLFVSAPRTERCVILNLGDYFHTDTVDNMTLAHKNILDVDTRWQKVFKTGIRIFREIIKMALETHKYVDIYSVEGNHDKHTSYALSLILDAYFENNERVFVNTDPRSVKYYTYGKNLIGVTHGTIKPTQLPGIMAADMPEEWGKSKYRVWYIGHRHHSEVKDYPGCVVETFRTLAPKDAWHYNSGYRTKRDIKRIVLDINGGEIERSTINI